MTPNGSHRPPDSALDALMLESQFQRLRYHSLFDFSPVAYVVTDRAGVITQVNLAAARLFGLSKEFLTGRPLPFFVAADQRRPFYRVLTGGHGQGLGRTWETRLLPARAAPVEVAVTALEHDDGAGYLWLVTDLSAQRRAELAYRAERSFADSLVDLMEAVILLVTPQGRVLRCNAFPVRAYGYDEEDLVGQSWWAALVLPGEREQARELLRAAASGASARGGVLGLLTRHGEPRAVDWSAHALEANGGGPRVLLVGHDVTALQEAQQKALRAERLAAIGQMVAGLAHESRNALQRSHACLSLLEFRLQGQPELLDLVNRIQKAQDDLGTLFNEVRGYAAPLRLERQPCDLAELWRSAWAELAPQRGPHAELREDCSGPDTHCTASPFHLRQVFRNLLANALRAGGERPEICIACEPTPLDGREAVRVTVRDNGPGFTPEARARAFEPFFTTSVQGTGLGLAICRRIVEAHGGHIGVGPNDRGAVIHVVLPRRSP